MSIVEIDVKEAVQLAFKYVQELFQAEQLTDLGLEEVEYDEASASWLVTVGFSRPWDVAKDGSLSAMVAARGKSRSFKIVRIRGGKVISLKNRDTASA